MKYNSDIHHRKSIRLKDYDYSQSGAYFVTICAYNRECLLGKIVDGKMRLNEYGLIAQDEWKRTKVIRKNIEIDEFIVMPNHMHGIIIIKDNGINFGRGTMHRAPTIESFGKPTTNTIPTIIRGYKSAVTNQINKLRNTPQTRFGNGIIMNM